jgi:hypothetical protein
MLFLPLLRLSDVSCIFGGLVLNGTIPLFYESAVENAYPIAEGSTTCLLTTFNNLGCLIFLFIPMDTFFSLRDAFFLFVLFSFFACLFFRCIVHIWRIGVERDNTFVLRKRC